MVCGSKSSLFNIAEPPFITFTHSSNFSRDQAKSPCFGPCSKKAGTNAGPCSKRIHIWAGKFLSKTVKSNCQKIVKMLKKMQISMNLL